MGWFEDNGYGKPPLTSWGNDTREQNPGVEAPYVPPGTTPMTSSALPGVLPGWDQTKWNDPSRTSPKYVIGRILAKYPPTVQGLQQAQAELQQAFPGLSFNGKDTLTIPGAGDAGQALTIDVLQNAGNGGTAWQWIDQAYNTPTSTAPDGLDRLPGVTAAYGGMTGYGGGYGGESGGMAGSGEGGTGGTGGTGLNGSAPAFSELPGFKPTTTFTPTAFAYTPLTPGQDFAYDSKPGAYTSTGAFTYDPLKASEAFKLPTGQEALDQDPGYQFRLDQGRKALESSAAGRGLLRTGGTLKDIQDFGQQAASQEYQNAVNRARDVYGINQSVRQSEQNQQYGQAIGAKAFNEATNLGEYQANLAGQAQGFGQAQTTNQQNRANRLAEYGLNAQTGLAANQQNNAFALSGAQFDYGQAKDAYDLAQQQNLAKNAQALQGYGIDTTRDLTLRQQNLTQAQNAVMNSLTAQQQAWMQAYMAQGQSWDEAYRQLRLRLEFPA